MKLQNLIEPLPRMESSNAQKRVYSTVNSISKSFTDQRKQKKIIKQGTRKEISQLIVAG